MKIISSSINAKFGLKLAALSGFEFIEAKITTFADGEIMAQISRDLNGARVFILTSVKPINNSIIETLFLIDAAKRMGAGEIIVGALYFWYSRQSVNSSKDVALSSDVILKMLSAAGACSVVAIDIHSENLQSNSILPLINLDTTKLAAKVFDGRQNCVIVSPDKGGVGRAQKLSKAIGMDLVILDKSRIDFECKITGISSTVSGKHCIIVDDIIDTAGTIVKAAEFLIEYNALSVEVFVTHSILSGLAMKNVEQSCLSNIYVTDTIRYDNLPSKFSVISVCDMLSDWLIQYNSSLIK